MQTILDGTLVLPPNIAASFLVLAGLVALLIWMMYRYTRFLWWANLDVDPYRPQPIASVHNYSSSSGLGLPSDTLLGEPLNPIPDSNGADGGQQVAQKKIAYINVILYDIPSNILEMSPSRPVKYIALIHRGGQSAVHPRWWLAGIQGRGKSYIYKLPYLITLRDFESVRIELAPYIRSVLSTNVILQLQYLDEARHTIASSDHVIGATVLEHMLGLPYPSSA